MIEVYTDAATAGNPGASAAGIYIKEHHQFSKYLGVCSNHEAEFLAVIHALLYCKDHFAGEIISIRSDSQLVVRSADAEHCRNPVYSPLLKQILELHGNFSYVFYKWIPDKDNKHADALARKELKKNQ
ncbi:ribonuclease HI family protein [Halobacillus sp. A5]|uniref:ribonuclease HI family protein n=1 Tax=Halobacillus sp. A5 TaxID=2880263 RepID=UPI0020A6878E|nr:ribonuclease HI family protein [Halobacillus sp. A5]MCP3025904.1 ribonuclease HI family protein [Halobacillus sp. A5]